MESDFPPGAAYQGHVRHLKALVLKLTLHLPIQDAFVRINTRVQPFYYN